MLRVRDWGLGRLGRYWMKVAFCASLLFASSLTCWAVNSSSEDFYANTPENHERLEAAMRSLANFDLTETLTPHRKQQFEEAGDIVSLFRFEEVADFVMIQLQDAVDKIGSKIEKDKSYTLKKYPLFHLGIFLSVLEKIGNRADASNFLSILEQMKEHIKILIDRDSSESKSVDTFLWRAEQIHEHMDKNNRKRASIKKLGKLDLSNGGEFLSRLAIEEPILLEYKRDDYTTAEEKGMAWVDEVRSRMEAVAKGQPEVVQSFLDLEAARVMDPSRDEPELRWMMGPQGTGKDMHVRAYVDAIHGYEGAWKEHLHELPVARGSNDATRLLGSPTGYHGSDKVSALVRFAVNHSGGSLEIVQEKSLSSTIEVVRKTNKKGTPPSAGVLYIDKFHFWSKGAIDVFLSKFLESGVIPIANPGSGEHEIRVPLTVVIASSDLSHLVFPESNVRGKRHTEEEAMDLWRRNHHDYERMKREVMKRNELSVGKTNDISGGVSSDVMDLVPQDGFLLMRPLTAKVVNEVAEKSLTQLMSQLEKSSRLTGPLKISFTQQLVDRVQSFEHRPMDGGRKLKRKINSMVRLPVLKALGNGTFTSSLELRSLELDIVENPDKSWNLVCRMKSSNGDLLETKEFLLPETQRLIPRPPMTDEEILRFGEFEKELNKRVVGAERIAKKMKEALLYAENMRLGALKNKARRFMFLGLSATGKTQVAKEIAKIYYGSATNFATIDFTGVYHESQVIDLIYGSRGSPSQFMQAYDAAGGNLVILLDEAVSIENLRALIPLYALLDEEEVTKFSDGESRSMKNVTLILTGNTGEEIYRGLPSHLPDHVRMKAMQTIFDKFSSDPNAQNELLRHKLTDALRSRVGLENTIFFSPFRHDGVRQLTQLKLQEGLKNLEEDFGRSYKVVWESEEEYLKALRIFEDEGFHIEGQGRSIDRYVREDFPKQLNTLLQEKLVPHGSEIVLSHRATHQIEAVESSAIKTEIEFNVRVRGSHEDLIFRFDGKTRHRELVNPRKSRIQTAWHEAGHELIRQVLFGDVTLPKFISIVPGVTEIAGEYVYYAGLAVTHPTIETTVTRQNALASVAKLIAGGEAQRLVNRGASADAGQSNDIQRVAAYVDAAILKFGLAKKWGLTAIPQGEKLVGYLMGLSDSRRKELESARATFMRDAHQMARQALAANFGVLTKIARLLAEKGVVHRDDLLKIYRETPVRPYWDTSPWRRVVNTWTPEYLKVWWQSLSPQKGRDLELVPSVEEMFRSEGAVIDVDKMILAEKEAALKAVPILEPTPVASPECLAALRLVRAL